MKKNIFKLILCVVMAFGCIGIATAATLFDDVDTAVAESVDNNTAGSIPSGLEPGYICFKIHVYDWASGSTNKVPVEGCQVSFSRMSKDQPLGISALVSNMMVSTASDSNGIAYVRVPYQVMYSGTTATGAYINGSPDLNNFVYLAGAPYAKSICFDWAPCTEGYTIVPPQSSEFKPWCIKNFTTMSATTYAGLCCGQCPCGGAYCGQSGLSGVFRCQYTTNVNPTTGVYNYSNLVFHSSMFTLNNGVPQGAYAEVELYVKSDYKTVSYDTSTIQNASDFTSQQVLSGSTVSAPTATPINKDDPSREFDYWTLNGAKVEFPLTVTSNVTLVPKWKASASAKGVIYLESYKWDHNAYNPSVYGTGQTTDTQGDIKYRITYYTRYADRSFSSSHILREYNGFLVDSDGKLTIELTSAEMQELRDYKATLKSGENLVLDIVPDENYRVLKPDGRRSIFTFDWIYDSGVRKEGCTGVRQMWVANPTTGVYELGKQGGIEEGINLYGIVYSENRNHTPWLTDENLDDGFSFKWKCYVVESSIVQFDLNGGTGEQPEDQYFRPISSIPGEVYNYLVDKPDSSPTMAGKQFVGWFKQNSDDTLEDTPWDFNNRLVTESMTLVAVYTDKSYQVDFVVDGQTKQTASLKEGDKPSWTGPDPTKAEDSLYTYTFTGWKETTGASVGSTYSLIGKYDFLTNPYRYLKNDTTGSTVEITSSFANTTVYTAQFEATPKPYTVTWKNNDNSTLATEIYLVGETPTYKVTTPTYSSQTIPASAMVFTGWAPTPAPVTGNATYTAQYKERDFTITYDANGGTLSGDSTLGYKYSDNVTLHTSATKNNYVFLGWKLDSSRSTDVTGWSTTETFPVDERLGTYKTGDVTLVAQWTQGYNYKLTFNKNSGSDPVSNMPSNMAETGWLPTTQSTYTYTWAQEPTREGYTFLGWATSSTGEVVVPAGTKSYTWDGVWNDVASANLYAKWEQSAYQATAAIADGDSGIDMVSGSGQYNAGTSVTFEATLKSGYEFAGWYDSEGSLCSGTESYTFSMPSSDITYYAKSVEGEVTYNYVAVGPAGSSYGSVSPTTETVGKVTGNPGSTATAGTGYKFVGWYDNAECSGTALSTDATYNPSKVDGLYPGGTFYAKFAADTANYTVKHWQQNIADDNYTEVTDDRETKSGTVGAQTEATAKSYTGFTAVTPIVQQTITADNNTVVDVYYDRNKHDVKYVVTNDDPLSPADKTVTYKYGATIDDYTPARTNYDFDGWYTDEEMTEEWTKPDTMPDNDITVYGQFIRQTAKLTLTKKGMSEGETALFLITGEGLGDGLEVSVAGNDGSITIADLLVGETYTITEQGDWSWKYTSGSAQNVSVSEKGKTYSATFTNTAVDKPWLNNETRHSTNVFSKVSE